MSVFPTPTPTPEQFFCVLKDKNANKVGFRIKRHLKTLVSVSDFPTPKIVASVSVSGVEFDTDTDTGLNCTIETEVDISDVEEVYLLPNISLVSWHSFF